MGDLESAVHWRLEAERLRGALERIDTLTVEAWFPDSAAELFAADVQRIARAALAATPGPLPVARLDAVTVEACARQVEAPACPQRHQMVSVCEHPHCSTLRTAARDLRALAGQAVPVEADPAADVLATPCPVHDAPKGYGCAWAKGPLVDANLAFCANRIRASRTTTRAPQELTVKRLREIADPDRAIEKGPSR